jgi:hypothetical protein
MFQLTDQKSVTDNSPAFRVSRHFPRPRVESGVAAFHVFVLVRDFGKAGEDSSTRG